MMDGSSLSALRKAAAAAGNIVELEANRAEDHACHAPPTPANGSVALPPEVPRQQTALGTELGELFERSGRHILASRSLFPGFQGDVRTSLSLLNHPDQEQVFGLEPFFVEPTLIDGHGGVIATQPRRRPCQEP